MSRVSAFMILLAIMLGVAGAFVPGQKGHTLVNISIMLALLGILVLALELLTTSRSDRRKRK